MDSCKSYQILRIYTNADSKYKRHNLCHNLVLKFRKMDIAGVTVIRGIEGYGYEGKIRTLKVFDLIPKLTVIIEVIDTCDNITKAVMFAKEIMNEGLIITSDIGFVKYGNDQPLNGDETYIAM